jgi:hypothetical protein
MKLNQLWRVSLPDVVRCFFTIYFLLSKRRFVHSIPFQQKDSLKLKPHKEKFHASNQITGNHLRGDDPQVRRVIRALIRSQNATSFITQLFCHWEIQNGLNKLIPRIYNNNRSAAYCVFGWCHQPKTKWESTWWKTKEDSIKRKKGEGEYTMTVTTVAEFRMQFMAAEKAKAGQLDFGGNKPIWSGAFPLLENAQQWRVR